jgi:hypothetical protein
MKPCNIFIIVLGVLIFINLAVGSSSPVPYYPHNMFAQQYPYGDAAATATDNNYSNEGFENGGAGGASGGLLSAGLVSNEQQLWYLSNGKTSPDCGTTSNGLSKSTGYLCLDPKEINYLQSRGGNATTKGDF